MVTNLSIVNNENLSWIAKLFQQIELALKDLDTLIDMEDKKHPERCQKLVKIKNECVKEFKEIQNKDWDYLNTEDNPDIAYECAEVSTQIYALIRRLKSSHIN